VTRPRLVGTRPRLKIVCEEHDRIIAMVVDTDHGPAYGNAHRGRDPLTGRRGFHAVYIPLDPSKDPIENPTGYQLYRRGPFPAYCHRCRRPRGDLDVGDLLKRGTIRI
jgi:hypothetical protein